jgi:hypothetical protein
MNGPYKEAPTGAPFCTLQGHSCWCYQAKVILNREELFHVSAAEFFVDQICPLRAALEISLLRMGQGISFVVNNWAVFCDCIHCQKFWPC